MDTVLQNEDNDWVKKCMEYEMEDSTVQTQRQAKENMVRGFAKRLSSM